jgi:hypothetical protein
MKPRNYAAIALLLSFTLAERFARYALTANVFPRLLRVHAMSDERIAAVFDWGSWCLLLGFAIGGGVSLATRSRWWLAGFALLLVLGHGYCAADPLFCIVGMPVVMLLAGVIRAPLYLALAEELDQPARVWKAIALTGCLYVASDIGGGLAGLVASIMFTASTAAGASVALPASVLALVACAVLAAVLPGQPFRFATTAELHMDGSSQAPYRAAPAVVRRDESPNRWIPLLALVAFAVSMAANAVQIRTTGQVLRDPVPGRGRVALLLSGPYVEFLMNLLIMAVALACASRRARFTPAWMFGAGLVVQGMALLLSIGAFDPISEPFAFGANFFNTAGFALVGIAALGYALGAVPSRWAGALAAASGIAGVAISKGAAIAVVQAQRALTPFIATSGVLVLGAAIAVLVLGPKLHRSSASRD